MSKKSRRPRHQMPQARPVESQSVAARPQQGDSLPVPRKEAPAAASARQSVSRLKDEDYKYVVSDLKRITIYASSIVAVLVILSFILK